jgi:antitoxin component YwqK of YwqJK toxin-antitoxin module
MKFKIFLTIVCLAVVLIATGQIQTDINRTDQQGRKQGHWIKNYPNGAVMYDGTFKDDKPVGEFKRFNTDNSLKSILIYSNDSREADATFYYPNGYISSKGKYIDQMKEGPWKFYSSEINGCLINEEAYTKNKQNGLSLKFYPDSTLAEKLQYSDGIKTGEWLQYYPNGKIFLKAIYGKGMLEGKFDTWYDNGNPHYSGVYKNNLRKGNWKIYLENGALKYEIDFDDVKNRDLRIDEESADFFDMIEKNMGKIPDPEKTGDIR